MKLESQFKSELKEKISAMFPGCYIFDMDPTTCQGIPDTLILHGKQWAMLESKRYASAPHRPNQDWYVEELNRLSFAAFIYPENEEEVLRELQQALRAGRSPRLPQR